MLNQKYITKIARLFTYFLRLAQTENDCKQMCFWRSLQRIFGLNDVSHPSELMFAELSCFFRAANGSESDRVTRTGDSFLASLLDFLCSSISIVSRMRTSSRSSSRSSEKGSSTICLSGRSNLSNCTDDGAKDPNPGKKTCLSSLREFFVIFCCNVSGLLSILEVKKLVDLPIFLFSRSRSVLTPLCITSMVMSS